MSCEAPAMDPEKTRLPDVRLRDQQFLCAKPRLRRLATRLLSSKAEVDQLVADVREAWRRTASPSDTPIRYLLRLTVHRCAIANGAQGEPSTITSRSEAQIMAIADDTQLSMLNGIRRMPKFAREAFFASMLDRAVAGGVKE